jgi:phage baseplate assembly protein W
MNDEIVGRGLAYPLRLGVAGVAESAGAAKVEESIRLVLGTRPGERVMRPDFGSQLHRLLFAPNTPATADLARYYVTESLTRWEPRIELLDVMVTADAARGALLIEIRYRLRATQGVHVLVHPFPLEGAT